VWDEHDFRLLTLLVDPDKYEGAPDPPPRLIRNIPAKQRIDSGKPLAMSPRTGAISPA